MFKYLRPQYLFFYSRSGRVIFYAQKIMCQLAILGTLCAYYLSQAMIVLQR
jgi:hypothetical protein